MSFTSSSSLTVLNSLEVLALKGLRFLGVFVHFGVGV